MGDVVKGKWVGQTWDAAFWKRRQDNLDAYLKKIVKYDPYVVFILPERPGKLLVDKCLRDSVNWKKRVEIDGFPPLCYLLTHWKQVELWREYCANRKEPKFTFIEIDDLVCRDRNVPCDDSILNAPNNRFDGVHYFVDKVGQQLVSAIFDRVLRRVGYI